MTISMVWAQASNGTIGAAGALPWHLPEDLARFRQLTTGATVLMGRRTWESLPERFRPLPDRRNLVLSRDATWQPSGAERVASVADALARADGDLWVIGGALVYDACLQHAQRAFVTELDRPFDGDVMAPQLDATWQLVDTDPADGWYESASGVGYRFATYVRAR